MPDRGEVTEQDLRMPEFRHAKLEDLEFREDDGKIVRKDRFKVSMYSIASAVGQGGRCGFECPEIVAIVKDLVQQSKMFNKSGWVIQNDQGLFLKKGNDVDFEGDLTKAEFFEDKSEAEHCIKDNPKYLSGCFIRFAKARLGFDITDYEPEEDSHAE
jgi:hypothetical protein